MARQSKKQQQGKKSARIEGDGAVPAEIVQLMGRAGFKGVHRVRCKVLKGNDSGKILVRNVAGPVNKGDILMLRETEMESAGGFSR